MQKLANVHFANREDCSNQKDHFKDFACDLLWNKRQHEKKIIVLWLQIFMF